MAARGASPHPHPNGRRRARRRSAPPPPHGWSAWPRPPRARLTATRGWSEPRLPPPECPVDLPGLGVGVGGGPRAADPGHASSQSCMAWSRGALPRPGFRRRLPCRDSTRAPRESARHAELARLGGAGGDMGSVRSAWPLSSGCPPHCGEVCERPGWRRAAQAHGRKGQVLGRTPACAGSRSPTSPCASWAPLPLGAVVPWRGPMRGARRGPECTWARAGSGIATKGRACGASCLHVLV